MTPIYEGFTEDYIKTGPAAQRILKNEIDGWLAHNLIVTGQAVKCGIIADERGYYQIIHIAKVNLDYCYKYEG